MEALSFIVFWFGAPIAVLFFMRQVHLARQRRAAREAERAALGDVDYDDESRHDRVHFTVSAALGVIALAVSGDVAVGIATGLSVLGVIEIWIRLTRP